jgi:hypothetical protein
MKRGIGETLVLKWRQIKSLCALGVRDGIYWWENCIVAFIHFALVFCFFYYIYLVCVFLMSVVEYGSVWLGNERSEL